MIQRIVILLAIASIVSTVSNLYAEQYEMIIKDKQGNNRSFTVTNIDSVYFRKLPTEGLQVYYPFEHRSEEFALKDLSGKGNDGSHARDALEKLPGRYEWLNAVYKQKEDDLIQVPNVINNKAQMTISLWFQSWYDNDDPGWHWTYGTADENNQPKLVEVGAAVHGDLMTYHFTTTNSGLKVKNGTRFIDGYTWYHILMTYDGNHFKTFVNNREDISIAMTGKVKTTQIQLIGGGYTKEAKEGFLGPIDDFRIYDRALTEEERKVLYQEGKQQVE